MKVLLTVPQDRPIGKKLPKSEQYPYVNDNGLASIAAACKNA